MTASIISILIALAGMALSIGASVYVSGRKRGELNTDVFYIKRDVAELKSLFKLTFVEPERRKRRI